MLGNHFILTVKVGIEEPADFSQLDQSIDYGLLAQIVRIEFDRPRKLIEELIGSIEKKVKEALPQIAYFFISIQKKNPPLPLDVMASEVILEKTYAS